MLIRFTVENFLSFGTEVEFSMLPGKTRKHPDHIFSSGKRHDTNVLKTAVIYGANASGKSNLIKAMDFAKRLILSGKQRRERISVEPFKLDTAFADKPSKFQFEFKHRSRAFIYGFLVDSQKVHEEWLYELTPTTEKLLFERKTSNDERTVIEFSNNTKFDSAKDREFLEFTAMGTRPNQLFLTESIERNVTYFEDAFDWFEHVLVILFPESRRIGLEFDLIAYSDFHQTFAELLSIFDTGVSSVRLEEADLDESNIIPGEIYTHFAKLFETEPKATTGIIASAEGKNYIVHRDEQNRVRTFKLMTGHQVKGQSHPRFFETSDESDGTQRLFDIIPALMELLNGERVFVIDELDRSLHPHLSYKILEMFLNRSNQRASQLIVTTHESSLLDLDLLRRDEIWFIEKNPEGMSSVYSLEEFAPRYDKDIRKGYLLGRFGAIPFVKSTPQFS